MHEALILCRFVHFGTVLLLFGISIFRTILFRPSLNEPGLSAHENSPLARRIDHCKTWLAAVAFLSAVAWLMLTGASMAGDLHDAVDLDTLTLVLGNTFFGHVWILHLALNLLVLLTIFKARFSMTLQTVLIASLLFTLAPVGHGAMFDGVQGQLLILNQLIHLGGVGTWLGGLFMLAMLLAAPQGIDRRWVLLRFSGIGYVLVATIVVTGLINVRALSGAFWPEPAFSGFGQVLAVKTGLVLAMLALAALNRTLAHAHAPNFALLKVSVLLECLFGAAALAAVALLGTLPPMLMG